MLALVMQGTLGRDEARRPRLATAQDDREKHTAAFGYSMKLSTMTGEVTRAQAAAAGPGATLLYDDWYPALRSDKIAGKHMATAVLLGIPLVLGRTSAGCYFAIRDTCPHRGIPLSYGWFDGQQVTCKYHGWS